jgi:hypothetical protein
MIVLIAAFGSALAVCAWTYLEGCRRRNLITRSGRLLHIGCLLALLGWHHLRHHVKAAWHLVGDIACWLLLMLVLACGALGTARRWMYSESPPPGAITRHPAAKRAHSVTPGLPHDGEPLTEAEKRAFRSITAGVDA